MAPPLTIARLHELLDGIRRLNVGVAGDFCLDAYWQLDAGPAEISSETGKPTHAVTSQRYGPGGAANVADNLLALGVSSIRIFGVTGADLFGRELRHLLSLRGIPTKWLLEVDGWQTSVFAKPHAGTEEQSRIDFGRKNLLTEHWRQAFLDVLRRGIPGLDVLVVNQQLARGVWCEELIHALNAQASLHPATLVLFDARHLARHFRGMVCKINLQEASALLGERLDPGLEPAALELVARAVHEHTGKPVYLTLGDAGMAAFDGGGMHLIAPLPLRGPIDPVGAGDTASAALATALAAGASVEEAGHFASIAASISIHKLRQTGTATPGEILRTAAALQSATG